MVKRGGLVKQLKQMGKKGGVFSVLGRRLGFSEFSHENAPAALLLDEQTTETVAQQLSKHYNKTISADQIRDDLKNYVAKLVLDGLVNNRRDLQRILSQRMEALQDASTASEHRFEEHLRSSQMLQDHIYTQQKHWWQFQSVGRKQDESRWQAQQRFAQAQNRRSEVLGRQDTTLNAKTVKLVDKLRDIKNNPKEYAGKAAKKTGRLALKTAGLPFFAGRGVYRAGKDTLKEGIKVLAPGVLGWFVILGLLTHFLIDWGWQSGFNSRLAIIVTPMTIIVDTLFALFLWMMAFRMQLKALPGILLVYALEVGWIGWIARTFPYLVQNDYTGFLFAKFFWPYWVILGIAYGIAEPEQRPHDHRFLNLGFMFLVLFWFFTIVKISGLISISQIGQTSSDLATDMVIENWQNNQWVNPFQNWGTRFSYIMKDPLANMGDFGAGALEAERAQKLKEKEEARTRELSSRRDLTLLDNTTFRFYDTNIGPDPQGTGRPYGRSGFVLDSPRDGVDIIIKCDIEQAQFGPLKVTYPGEIELIREKKMQPEQTLIAQAGPPPFQGIIQLTAKDIEKMDIYLGCRPSPNLVKGSYNMVFKAEIKNMDVWGFVEVLYGKPSEITLLRNGKDEPSCDELSGLYSPSVPSNTYNNPNAYKSPSLTQEQCMRQRFSYYRKLFEERFGPENIFRITYPQDQFITAFTNKPVIGDIFFSYDSPIIEIKEDQKGIASVDWQFAFGNDGPGKILSIRNITVGLPKGMTPVERLCGKFVQSNEAEDLTYFQLKTEFGDGVRDINDPYRGKTLGVPCFGKVPNVEEFLGQSGFIGKRTELSFTADYEVQNGIPFAEYSDDITTKNFEEREKSMGEIIRDYSPVIQTLEQQKNTELLSSLDNQCLMYATIAAASSGNPEHIDRQCGGRIGLTGVDPHVAIEMGLGPIYEKDTLTNLRDDCLPAYAGWITFARKEFTEELPKLDARFNPDISIRAAQKQVSAIVAYLTEHAIPSCKDKGTISCIAAAYASGTCTDNGDGTEKGALCISTYELCNKAPNFLCKDAWQDKYARTASFAKAVHDKYDECKSMSGAVTKDAIAPKPVKEAAAQLTRDKQSVIVRWKPSPDDSTIEGDGAKDVQRYLIIFGDETQTAMQPSGQIEAGKPENGWYRAIIPVSKQQPQQQKLIIITMDTAGNSASSDPIIITQENKPPQTVSGLSVSVQNPQNAQVQISWNKAEDDGAGEFDILLYQLCEYAQGYSAACCDSGSIGQGCKTTVIPATGKESYSTQTNVQLGVTYVYKVCAKDMLTSCGPYSEEKSTNIPVATAAPAATPTPTPTPAAPSG
ncbi:hypothetical protein HZB01_00530 [Candidatus Woesearchaeota archaeon]|nr:hypothetical protein [Candidatus Woesearchaeota archaeon]